MLDYLRAYKSFDPSAKSLLEIALLYPGPKALFFHRVAHVFYRYRLFFIARLISEVSRFITLIEIHPGAQIGKRLVIDHGSGVVIGETAIVGDDCKIYHGVTLGGTSSQGGRRHPKLENNVLVGAGAKILGPIQVGAGAKIGANSVVVKDCLAEATYVGVPAQRIR